MKLTFHTQALAILYLLQKAGYEAYIVGGAVRDIFLRELMWQDGRIVDLKSYDYDFTTNAKPDQILAALPESFYENDFGTVSITPKHLNELLIKEGIRIETENLATSDPTASNQPETRIIDYLQATKIHESLKLPSTESSDHKPTESTKTIPNAALHNYEITTYRSQEVYEQDFRRPTKLEWGETIEDDLGRRDFTINAMAVKISQDFLTQTLLQGQKESVLLPPTLDLEVVPGQVELIDLYEGWADLQNGILRCVGNPPDRFEEDALRILRCVRFSVQLDLEIEEQTWGALKLKAPLLEYISQERIRDEFLKMLASPAPAQAINVLDQTDLLKWVLPELLPTKGCDQSGHHATDVWTHALDSLYYCPSRDPIVRLACLIHDIGKPPTQRWQDGQFTFYNHQHVGAKIAKEIGLRLRLSKHEVEKLVTLVRFHMFHYQPQDSDASVRRLMREVGLENLDDLLAVREGDRLGSGAKKTSWRLEELKERMIAQLHQPMDVRDLAIDGHVLMTELNLKPGPILGQTLNYLLECVLDDSDLNQPTQLLNLARDFIQKS